MSWELRGRGEKRHLLTPYVNLKAAEALAKPKALAFRSSAGPLALGRAVVGSCMPHG